MVSTAAFFTVSDARYFLGTVALVNSLRFTGNHQDVVVLDAGLREDQRRRLSSLCRIIPLADADSGAANPTYYKLVAPSLLTDDSGIDVIVLIDSDMIVTRDLAPLIDAARSGKVVAHPDPEFDRWCSEWAEIFALPSEPRRQTYVNAGLVAFARSSFPTLLTRWQAACARIADLPTVAEGATGPASQADQDALNAVLMSTYPPDALEIRPADEAPQGHQLPAGSQFSRPRIVDRSTLSCRYRGTNTLVLHASGNPKPWTSWHRMGRTAYTELLVDVLARPDAAIGLSAAEVPWWLRPGRPRAAARALFRGMLLVRAVGRRLLRALARRIRRLSGRSAAGSDSS